MDFRKNLFLICFSILLLIIPIHRDNIKFKSTNFNSDFYITTEYSETNSDIIYFDVSNDNHICIAYSDDNIYEYDNNGNFIRKIYYKTPGSVYSYYLNDNLVIYVLRENLNIVLDYNNDIVKKFESKEIYSGYYTSADFTENIRFTKNGYDYYYSNANWFQRRVKEKSYLSITYNGENILTIYENINVYSDFIPIFIVLLCLIVAGSILIIRIRKRVNES